MPRMRRGRGTTRSVVEGAHLATSRPAWQLPRRSRWPALWATKTQVEGPQAQRSSGQSERSHVLRRQV
jgi:hypothetical protein